MANAIITIRSDIALKRKAQKLAESLGLDLSAVINRQLREFVEKKEINFREPLIPNKKTAKSLRQAEEEYKRGESFTFGSPEETFESLRSIANE